MKFVPADQIDPMWLDKSYYLEPDKAATKPYILLRDALESERVAIVTVSIRTRMTMAVLRVRDGVIVMQTMILARRDPQARLRRARRRRIGHGPGTQDGAHAHRPARR